MTLKVVVKKIPVGLAIACFFLTTILSFSTPAWAVPNGKSINVGLYPYVPRLDQFKQSLESAWQQIEPEVSLNILPSDKWDGGYDLEPPENIDVYVFDAIFLNYFRSQGWLLPLKSEEVQGADDFLSYAIQGVKSSPDTYDAIPQLGCTNILFYWNTDTPLKNARNLDDIYHTIGQCRFTSQEPPNREGLMVDMAGGTTNACLYIDALASTLNQFPVPKPWKPQEVNQEAIANLRKLLRMSSYDNATQDTSDPYIRANWFSNGQGRAVIGFTESMSVMNQEALKNIDLKVMPLSNDDRKALFYADVIGIHPKTVERGNRELAVKLANLIASSDYMVNSIGADKSGIPQYLMPTRHTVFNRLSQSNPNYQKMYNLVETANPILFTLDSQVRTWLNTMKGTIKQEIRANYSCGCDLEAGSIWSQEDAKNKCPNACANNGGWNGEWTTTQPGIMSVCGCNTCGIK